MAEMRKLCKSDLPGFDNQAVALIESMGDQGWIGRISSKGHAIMRAPDSTSMAIGRESKRGRSGLNAAAEYRRWLKTQQPSGVPGSMADEPLVCPDCEKTFPSVRALSAHSRKHSMVKETCPDCGKQVVYLESHRVRSHGTGAKVNATEALMSILMEIDHLRAENAAYRRKYGDLN